MYPAQDRKHRGHLLKLSVRGAVFCLDHPLGLRFCIISDQFQSGGIHAHEVEVVKYHRDGPIRGHLVKMYTAQAFGCQKNRIKPPSRISQRPPGLGPPPLFASDNFMKKLSDEQREQIMRAAVDAGNQFSDEVRTETEEVREWLVSEGGMTRTDPDRADFIAAAQTVQQSVAAERGQEFVDLVNMINAAAE